MADLSKDSKYFLELQTKTGWSRVLERFADWSAPAPGALAVDIGTGPGLFAALLAERGARAIGLDLDQANFTVPQHDALAVADALQLPFGTATIDLATASNLLFLLPDPPAGLAEIARVLRPGGQLCTLNPSEIMNIAAATALADEAELEGLARDTLINYGRRAEKYHAWGEADLVTLFVVAGLTLIDTKTTMGVGLVRFARAFKAG